MTDKTNYEVLIDNLNHFTSGVYGNEWNIRYLEGLDRSGLVLSETYIPDSRYPKTIPHMAPVPAPPAESQDVAPVVWPRKSYIVFKDTLVQKD